MAQVPADELFHRHPYVPAKHSVLDDSWDLESQDGMPAIPVHGSGLYDVGDVLAMQRAAGNRATRAALQAQALNSKDVSVKSDPQNTKASDDHTKTAAVPEERSDKPRADASLAGPEKLSPLREALLEQFRLMEGKGIGDEEFEKICQKDWWEKRKKKEKEAKEYNKSVWPLLNAAWQAEVKANPEYAKTHKRPPREDDAVFTTCIATQSKLLELAFKAVDLHVKRPNDKVKYDVFGYATMGRIEAKKRGAWVEAKPEMKERPQIGDVLILEMRGDPDSVQKKIDAENSQYGLFGQREKSLLKQIKQTKMASEGANEALAQAAAAKLPELGAKLAELRKKHDEKLAELQVKLDEARKKTVAAAGTEKEIKNGRMGGLAFSHVGMFKGRTFELDAHGKKTGREIWTTFDGGQFVPGKIDAQGAKTSTRIYNPKTNEIVGAKQGAAGEVTQDGKTRWLGGWANIDALVDEVDPYGQ